VAAPVERVWAAATDWARQGEWMAATTVQQLGEGRLRAVTGFAGLGAGIGLVDRMEIVEWDPPRVDSEECGGEQRRGVCRVQHVGPVLRGDGIFEVWSAGSGARFVWIERLVLPGGAVGRLAWRATEVPFGLFARWSLRRFARFAASYR
jgi:hypothetical protein